MQTSKFHTKRYSVGAANLQVCNADAISIFACAAAGKTYESTASQIHEFQILATLDFEVCDNLGTHATHAKTLLGTEQHRQLLRVEDQLLASGAVSAELARMCQLHEH